MQIRDAIVDDIAGVQAIYAHHVLHGLGTFETLPPTLDEMRGRHAQITSDGFPYLIAEESGRVLGFVYANHFRTRAAYRNTVEDSIYVAPDAMGRRIGSGLLNALIGRCTSLGLRQMLAVIGDSENEGSLAVHRGCGFAHAGVMKAVGRKFDQWVDVVIMQRALGAGASTPPD